MPNIITNPTKEEYSSIDALNYSSFKHFITSPKHYRDYCNTVQEETPAMRLGTAMHSAILTPQEFARDYTYAPEVDRRTREGRQIWEEFTQNNPNKIILKKEEFDICIAASESAFNNEYFVKHRTSKKCVVENAYVGDMCGVAIKGRIDLYDEESNTIIDLKSISEVPTVEECRKAMYKNKYYVQAHFYSELIKQNYGRTPTFVFGFIEKKSPFSIAYIQPDDYTLNVARNICEREIVRYSNCKHLDKWPSFAHSDVPAQVSIWVERNITSEQSHLID